MKDDRKPDSEKVDKGPGPAQENDTESPPAAQWFFLDRIEGDIAVLLLATGDDEIELEVERDLLPPGAREGDWLRAETDEKGQSTYHIDRDATASAKSRVQNLLDELS